MSRSFYKNITFYFYAVFLSFTLSGCGLFSCSSSSNEQTNIAKIEIAPLLNTLPQGIKLQMAATVFYHDGSKLDITQLVNWTSSDTTISTIDENGLLSAISPGTHTVSIRYQQFSAQKKITINNATLDTLNINPANPSLVVNTNISITVIGIFSNDATLDVSNQVSWNINNETVLSIIEKNRFHGIVAGNSLLTASLNNISTSTNVEVKVGTLSAIQIENGEGHIFIGDKIPLHAFAIYEEAFKQDISDQVDWSVSDDSIITINSNIATILNTGDVNIIAKFDDVETTKTITIVDPKPALLSLEIKGINTSLSVTDQSQLELEGTYSDNTIKNLTQSALWSSENTDILEISNSSNTEGQIRALQSGNATITAKVNNQTVSLVITINEAELQSIEITPQDQTLYIGKSLNLTAKGTYSDSTLRDITKLVAWRSEHPDFTHVSNEDNNRGITTALKVGTVNISASLSGISSFVTINSEAELQSIEITPPHQTLAINTSLQLVATGIYSDSTSRDLTTLVTWQSEDPNLITAGNEDGNHGKITALKTGTTKISASMNDLANNTEITINNSSLININIENTRRLIHTGLSSKFEAMGIYSDGTKQNITSLVTWKSSDPTIVLISDDPLTPGAFSALSVGTTAISASLGNISSTFNINTVTSAIDKIVINNTQTSIVKETTLQLDATVFYIDHTSDIITTQGDWSSDNTQILTASNSAVSKGLIAAIRVGDAAVKIEYHGVIATLNLNVNNAILTEISITPQNISLANNTWLRLSATGIYSNDQSQDITQQVLWSSNDSEIVFISNAINSKGKAYAFSAGQATVTAKMGTISSDVVINVNDENIIGINIFIDGESEIATGSQKILRAEANYASGARQDLTQQVSWQSADPTICTITTSINNPGILLGLSNGLCTITARFGDKTATALLTITAASLQSISITPVTISLPKGTQIQLAATGHYSDTTTQDLTRQVSWQSSSPAFTINNDGLLNALTIGSGTVQANLLDITVSTDINVNTETLKSISITPASPTLNKGLNRQFKAIGAYTDISEHEITQAVLWSSSDKLIATVSNDEGQAGLVNALSAGTTSISAKLDEIFSSTNIIVESNPTAPISMSIGAAPYVILNNGVDTAIVSIKVLAIDNTQQVADGTKVNLSILNGNATLDSMNLVTSGGNALFTLQSTYNGRVSIQATIKNTDITNEVSVRSTDNFGKIFSKAVLLSATVIDNIVQTKSQFGLGILNDTNRPFNLIGFRLGTLNKPTYEVDLSNNTLQPGQYISLGWETKQEQENTFRAVFYLNEPNTNANFTIGVAFNLPANYSNQ